MLEILIPVAADVLKALLPSLLQFFWEQAHAPTTIEDALPDDARRQRLLAAVHLRYPGAAVNR